MARDPYTVLGVPHGADETTIRDAYRKLAKQYHPDLHPNDPYAAQKMNELNEAYDAIRNPQQQKRTDYTDPYSPYTRPSGGYGSYGSGGYGSGGYGSYRESSSGGYETPNGDFWEEMLRQAAERERQRRRSTQQPRVRLGCLLTAMVLLFGYMLLRFLTSGFLRLFGFVFGG